MITNFLKIQSLRLKLFKYCFNTCDNSISIFNSRKKDERITNIKRKLTKTEGNAKSVKIAHYTPNVQTYYCSY